MLLRSSLLWLAALICTWKYGVAQNSPPTFPVVIDSVSFLEFEEEDASEFFAREMHISRARMREIFLSFSDFTVYEVEATDPDGDTVTYYIPSNSLNSDKFRVDSATGKVFPQAGVVLDREVGPCNISLCDNTV